MRMLEMTMASTKRTLLETAKTTHPALAPATISHRDLQLVEALLIDVAPQWAVELHGTSIEDASLVIVPENGEDACGPTFAISTEAFDLRVHKIHWDDVTELGFYPDINAAVAAVSAALEDFTASHVPANVTIH